MTSSHPIPPQAGIEHDPSTETYRTSHDRSADGAVGTTVLALAAAANGVDPTELAPLNDYVDPDALDSLFAPREDGSARHGGTVSFRFEGCSVAVHGDGTVSLRVL